jgi:iron(III) transport system permease protein
VPRLPLVLSAAFCALFIGAPLLSMLWDTLDGPDGFTLAGYAGILSDPVDRSQLAYSIGLGVCATAVAFVFGAGHAFLTHRTDVPAARILAPLGVAPLIMPPILIAMGFADLWDMSGFWACAGLLGLANAPFVAVLTARGLRATDGRTYEAALVARGRGAAERLLLRSVIPEISAGCLFAFVFVIAEHGVPEFLTVKGKTWHTYAEGVFAKWTRRATGTNHEDLISPIIAALPLLVIIALALFFALRLRSRTDLGGNRQAVPTRHLGAARVPAFLLSLIYLAGGVGVPLVVMSRWALGSTQHNVPMSVATLRTNLASAIDQAGGDLTYTIGIGAAASVLTILIALPLAGLATRRFRYVEQLSVLPLAVPAILLAIGFVHVFNNPIWNDFYDSTGDFYDSAALLVCAYSARLLPFGVLTLSHAARRHSRSIDEAALLTGRSPTARFLRIRLPLLTPAIWSAACLVFVLAVRELDTAVLLPAGNSTVVRRLSNIVHFGGEDMGGALALLLVMSAVLIPLVAVLLRGRKLEALS